MRKVTLFSTLLIAGLVGSQVLPGVLGGAQDAVALAVRLLTMVGLSFIMIHVGYEFDVDRGNLRSYGWDYVVAMTAAAFPWLFATLYLVFVVLPAGSADSYDAWKETLLAGRFAAPTSAGVLFSMLAAAGLAGTWLFRKARVLAIFDDLDTVLLMIPLKALMVGWAWQLGAVVGFMALLLWVAWRWLHRIRLPVSWPWVLLYAVLIVAFAEGTYVASRWIDVRVPIHLEVLLPAFVLGCVLARPPGSDPHRDDAREGHQEGPESPAEQRVSTIVSAAFMVLVGLSMPSLAAEGVATRVAGDAAAVAGATSEVGGGEAASPAATVTGSQPSLPWGEVVLHVLALTVLVNLGKMFPAFCYRREAAWRTRLALAIGMWPRGEVGAGVLVVSLSYGIGGPVVTIAMLSLALNLVLTGGFVLLVRRLLAADAARGAPAAS